VALKPFTMPKWGIEMAEGTVAEWLVAEDAPFTKGTLLALIETDKITNEIEAESDGRLVRLIAQSGEIHPVGALIAVWSDGEAASAEAIDALVKSFRPADTAFAGGAAAAPAPAPAGAAPIPDDAAISPAARAAAEAAGLDVSGLSGSGRGGRITAQDVYRALRPTAAADYKGPLPLPGGQAYASPMAQRLAATHGVDLAKLNGSGPRGRISRADVLASVPKPAPPAVPVAPAPAGEVEVRPMSSMRRTIARRLTEAKTTIPHFYLRRRVRADRLLAARAGAAGTSVNDWLVRASALALMEVPALNIQVHGSDVHHFGQADISVAVATDRGLVTPVLRGAERLGVAAIGAAMRDLAGRARANRLTAADIEGGSFSLSNLGSFGVEQFDAIINPPQGAILAIGAARPEPIDDDGAIRVVPVLHFSLSCDHRAIDGADGARFLAALAALIEEPARLA
jgi:pyruvate dehydrogenase E2 component (dihydrolipoamide acetyltransferase)